MRGRERGAERIKGERRRMENRRMGTFLFSLKYILHYSNFFPHHLGQYPDTYGAVKDWTSFTANAHKHDALVVSTCP